MPQYSSSTPFYSYLFHRGSHPCKFLFCFCIVQTQNEVTALHRSRPPLTPARKPFSTLRSSHRILGSSIAMAQDADGLRAGALTRPPAQPSCYFFLLPSMPLQPPLLATRSTLPSYGKMLVLQYQSLLHLDAFLLFKSVRNSKRRGFSPSTTLIPSFPLRFRSPASGH